MSKLGVSFALAALVVAASCRGAPEAADSGAPRPSVSARSSPATPPQSTTTTLEPEQHFGVFESMAFDGSKLWITTKPQDAPALEDPPNGLFRVDPASQNAELIARGQSGPLSAGFGSIWVADPGACATRFDPATGEVQMKVTSDPKLCTGLVAGPDAMWTLASNAGQRPPSLVRIDPTSGAATTIGPLSFLTYENVELAAVTKNAVWLTVTNAVPDSGDTASKRRLVQVDPRTAKVVKQHPFDVGKVVGTGNHLWATRVCPCDSTGDSVQPATTRNDELFFIDDANGSMHVLPQSLPARDNYQPAQSWIVMLRVVDDQVYALEEQSWAVSRAYQSALNLERFDATTGKSTDSWDYGLRGSVGSLDPAQTVDAGLVVQPRPDRPTVLLVKSLKVGAAQFDTGWTLAPLEDDYPNAS